MNIKRTPRVFFQIFLFALISLNFSTWDLRAQKAINPEELLFVDFSVSLGNKSREISYLSRIDPSSFKVSDPNSWLVINQLRGSQALVILLDLNSLDAASLENVRTTVKSLLRSMPENTGQRFMLASLSSRLTFHQFFTAEKSEIITSLDSISAPSKRLD